MTLATRYHYNPGPEHKSFLDFQVINYIPYDLKTFCTSLLRFTRTSRWDGRYVAISSADALRGQCHETVIVRCRGAFGCEG